jgi:ubiquinone/menaquinone biosynthesis C-methylase UbiE
VNAQDERQRVGEAYERYEGSGRMRRKWSADNPGNMAIRAALTAKLLDAIGDRLAVGDALDLGCGTGWWLRTLAESGIAPQRLHGAEILAARAAAARKAVPGADIREADARALPFDDHYFDAVTMICLLSSLGDREGILRALGEARRVLRRGGLLLVYEPRVPNPLNRGTRFVSRRVLREALGPGFSSEPLTVLPPLVRAMERAIPGSYRRLAQIGPLLTHRLVAFTG